MADLNPTHNQQSPRQTRGGLNRTLVNLVVDLAAAALFLGMMATGYILWFALPPGTNKALSLWDLTRHQWGTVHAWISFALLGVLFLHLSLHWQWVVAVVRKRLGLTGGPQGGLWRSGLATLAAAAAVLGLFAWLTQVGVRNITDAEEFGVCPPGTATTKGTVNEASSPGAGPEGAAHPPAFWKDVYPVLETHCASCHGPRRQSGDFRMDRREDFFGAAGKSALVIPGDSGRSPLIAIVSGRRRDLPRPDAHQLPEGEVAVLRAWIDAGANWPERPSQPDQ